MVHLQLLQCLLVSTIYILGPVCFCGHRSRVPGNRDGEKPRFRRFSDKQRFSSFARVLSLPRSLNARPPRGVWRDYPRCATANAG
jgi:hypothetical protein